MISENNVCDIQNLENERQIREREFTRKQINMIWDFSTIVTLGERSVFSGLTYDILAI